MKKSLPSLIFFLIVVSKLMALQSVSIGPAYTSPSDLLSLNAAYNGLPLFIPVVKGAAAVPNTVAGIVTYDQMANATMLCQSNTAWKIPGGAITHTFVSYITYEP